MRFHCLGLAHTATNHLFLSCAFTQKVLKFCKMMHELGHEIIHYGNEGSDVLCSEHVQMLTKRELEDAYGAEHWNNMNIFAYMEDTPAQQASHTQFNQRTIEAVRQRAQPNDFLLCFFGLKHQPIAAGLMDTPLITVEPGIGYPRAFTTFRVFESYARMHHEKGFEGSEHRPDWTDAVIPNYFDLDDFEYREQKDDFLLYIGRLIPLKGVQIAVELAKATKTRLKVAGFGNIEHIPGDLNEFVEVIGHVHREQRRELYAGAKAVLMPTYYLEPFGGVNVEAQLSGTPVITTDWGVFPETVKHGVTGYRCRFFDQFVWAVENIHNIKPADCRAWAEQYSLERVALMYHEYFESLKRHIENGVGTSPNWQDENDPQAHMNVTGNFFYLNPERNDLDWLVKPYANENVETKREAIKTQIAEDISSPPVTQPPQVVAQGEREETAVWDYLINEVKISSVLDIGAGNGQASLYFGQRGVYSIAIDSNTDAKTMIYPIVQHDFQQSPFEIQPKFALAYLFEFLAALPAQALPNFAKTLHCVNSLLFTISAPPLESGEINYEPMQYWLDWFQQQGFTVDEIITNRIREIAIHPEMSDFSVFMTAPFQS